MHRITVDGARHPELGSVDGTLYVTRDGLVRFGRWAFDPSDGDEGRVLVTMYTMAVDHTATPARSTVLNENAPNAGA